MADESFDTLASIYQMMSPTDSSGTPMSNNKNSAKPTPISTVFSSIFDVPGGGLKTMGTLLKNINQLLSKATDDQKKEIESIIRLYSTFGHLAVDQDWQLLIDNPDDADDELVNLQDSQAGMADILGLEDASKKNYGIILSDEPFMSPATIGARDSELFLNSMPSYVMSRCVPYLSTEFVFDRPMTTGKNQTLNAPSILKFLLGAQDTATNNSFAEGTANDIMIKANSISSGKISDTLQQTDGKDTAKALAYDQTIAGMELFTAPQTLLNPNPLPYGSRYVPVIDPMRPLASVENLTVSVAPTFGLMSFKTATLTLKVHDRSRLHELADLIKPLIYSQTSVWLTYGWRHPVEPNNVYANFVNNKMLTREVYGISNSSYQFDHVGQATITLQLYTKGTRELRDIKITEAGQYSFGAVNKRIQKVVEDIKKYRHKLHLDKPVGVLKEIRSYQLLEAASNGSDPNIDVHEISKVLNELERSFLKQGASIDKVAADKLRDSIEELYSPVGKGKDAKFAYKEMFDRVTKQATDKLLTKIRTTADPFLMSQKKDETRQKQQNSTKTHPFTELIESYNKRTFRNKKNRKRKVPKRHIVSFGKLFSTFVGNAISNVDGVDELQLFFYPMNQKAGLAAGVNISEFPIDMHIFLDQYRDHISRRQSDKITVEEFLKLVVDAQMQDVRGIGYGLFGFLEPYDPKTRKSQIKKGQSAQFQSTLSKQEQAQGQFKLPVITTYIESAHVGNNNVQSSTNSGQDLLDSFDRDVLQLNGAHDKNYTKIMRIHVFDKTVDPYPLSSAVLRGDDGTSTPIPNVFNDTNKVPLNKANVAKIEKTLQQNGGFVDDLLEINSTFGVVVKDENANQRVKDFVSQTIPTISYGSNASMILNANITTKQDALLTSVQMMANKSGRPSVTQPNGGGTMGLPLRVIPAAISVETMGCNLIRYAQQFFFDYNTGTTLDNRTVVTGINHNIGPGKFETSMDLTWYDSYGQYESKPTLYNYLKLIDAPLTAEDE